MTDLSMGLLVEAHKQLHEPHVCGKCGEGANSLCVDCFTKLCRKCRKKHNKATSKIAARMAARMQPDTGEAGTGKQLFVFLVRVGQVVKASVFRATDPGFNSCLRQDLSGSGHTIDLKLALQWLPCQASVLKKLALQWLPCQAPVLKKLALQWLSCQAPVIKKLALQWLPCQAPVIKKIGTPMATLPGTCHKKIGTPMATLPGTCHKKLAPQWLP